MNLYDFDRAFYEYCAAWLKEHPGVTEEQLDDEYNALMAKWLDAPVSALGGATPKAYFAAYNEPEELLDMLEACE